MKKDELLDMITELKVDDAFVDEALGEQDGAPVRVYAGKRSPMRIAAPIAACLAVAAAAGFVFVNVSRGKFAVDPAASIEESSEVDETSEPVIDEPEETTFVDKCKDIVTAELTNDLPEDAQWLEVNFDIDFDGEDELMLCPYVQGEKLEGVPGVRVFKDNGEDSVIDLGAWHLGKFHVADFYSYFYYDENGEAVEVYDESGFDYIDEAKKKCYYFDYGDGFEAHSDTIYEVYYNEETGVVEEKEYLRFVSTYPEDESSSTPFTEKAYRYGVEIGMKEFLEEWKPLPNVPNILPGCGKVGMIKVVDILTEKYGISEDDYTALMRPYRTNATVYADDGKASISVGLIDANGDGRNELLVTFKNCEQLPGIYIFERDNGETKLIGSFDLEGKRLGSNALDVLDLNGERLNETGMYETYDDDNGERFHFYFTYNCEKRGDTGVERYDMHKITANADGTLGDEIILTYGTEFTEDGGVRSIGQINGEDVTYAEATAEWNRIVTVAENYDGPNRYK